MSPNIAPPTTAPTTKAIGIPVLAAIPVAIGTNATIVPMDVPIDIAIKHAIIKTPATSMLLGKNVSPKLTVDSTAPIVLATSAKAPANINIRHIKMMFGSPAPLQNTSNFLSSDTFLFINNATNAANKNGTVTGIA